MIVGGVRSRRFRTLENLAPLFALARIVASVS